MRNGTVSIGTPWESSLSRGTSIMMRVCCAMLPVRPATCAHVHRLKIESCQCSAKRCSDWSLDSTKAEFDIAPTHSVQLKYCHVNSNCNNFYFLPFACMHALQVFAYNACAMKVWVPVYDGSDIYLKS